VALHSTAPAKDKAPMKMTRAWIVLAAVLCVACRTPSPPKQRVGPLLTLVRVQEMKVQQPDGSRVGGLSAINYDAALDVFVVLSDDRGERGPAHFHTLKVTEHDVTVLGTVTLLAEDGQPFPVDTLDPEGLALWGTDKVVISSEGLTGRGIPPFVAVFDRATGALQQRLPVPDEFLPDGKGTRGVGDNYGFEGLALCSNGPLLVVHEAPLLQETGDPSLPGMLHVLRYRMDAPQQPPDDTLRYPLDPRPAGMSVHGVTSLWCLDGGRSALVLERSWSKENGFLGRIYHADFSVTPTRKTLVTNLNSYNIRMDNFEGLTEGPRLPDGRRSLVMVSDDNFLDEQKTLLVWFALE
jgi:hypothetical protein